MHGRLTAGMNRQLHANSGLSLADYEVLVHLTEAPRAAPPVSLAPCPGLGAEPAVAPPQPDATSRSRGREECADDGRGAYVVLTDAGRQAIATAAPGHAASVQRLVFDHLSAEQVATLETIATQFLDRLDTKGAGC